MRLSCFGRAPWLPRSAFSLDRTATWRLEARRAAKMRAQGGRRELLASNWNPGLLGVFGSRPVGTPDADHDKLAGCAGLSGPRILGRGPRVPPTRLRLAVSALGSHLGNPSGLRIRSMSKSAGPRTKGPELVINVICPRPDRLERMPRTRLRADGTTLNTCRDPAGARAQRPEHVSRPACQRADGTGHVSRPARPRADGPEHVSRSACARAERSEHASRPTGARTERPEHVTKRWRPDGDT